ncbi:MAG TPA: hypothetical protein DCZ30_03055 [Clostridiales bacterium]|nr:hypothetical protein [Clostridiales bacterium]
MGKFEGKIVMKLIMVLCIIITMLFSSFMPIITWAVEIAEDNTSANDDEYVNFNLTWNQDGITEQTSTNSGIGDSNPKVAYFKIDFNTIKTGFKNFKIVVLPETGVDIDLSGNKTGENSIFAGNYGNTLMLNGNIPAGTSVTGHIIFKFHKKEDEDFRRNLKVQLIGEYEIDGETVYVEQEKELTVILKEEISKPCSVNLDFEKVTENNNNVDYNKDYSVTTKGVKWDIEKKYKLNVNIADNAQYAKIILKGLKSGSSDINNTPVNITVDSTFFSISEYNKEEGTLILTKGNKETPREDSELFKYNNNIYITVRYDLTGEKDSLYGSKGRGYYFNLNITAKCELYGYDYYKRADKQGEEETYNPVTKEASANCDTKEFVKNEASVGITPILHGGNYEKVNANSNITQSMLKDFSSKGYMDIGYMSYMNIRNVNKETIGKLYTYNYNFTEEDVNIRGITKNAETLKNEKAYIEYTNEDGFYGVKNVTPKLKRIEFKHLEKISEGARVLFYKRGDIEGTDEPFFIAKLGSLTYDVPDNVDIREYYAVYDVSNIKEDCNWENAPSTYWTSDWRYDKESIGLTDNEIENIKSVGRYQETVVKREAVANSVTASYIHTKEDWSKVSAIQEGVSANTRMNFTRSSGAELDNIRIKRISLGNKTNIDADFKIYRKDANEDTDEPIAVLNKNGATRYEPEDDFIEFYVVENIKEDLKEIYKKEYSIFVEYEKIKEGTTEISKIIGNLEVVSDCKEVQYNTDTKTITGTTKGTVYDGNFDITCDEYLNNMSVSFAVRYEVAKENFCYNLDGNVNDVDLSDIGKTKESTLRIKERRDYWRNTCSKKSNNIYRIKREL